MDQAKEASDIQTLHEHVSCGRYSRAVDGFRKLLNDHVNDLSLSVELADTFNQAGYVNKAAECLELALSSLCEENCRSEQVILWCAAEIMLAYMKSMITACFDDAIKVANEKMVILNHRAEDIVEKEPRIFAQAQNTGKTSFAQIPSTLDERLMSTMSELIANKSYRIAMRAAQELIGSTYEKQAFEALSMAFGLPELIWARVTLKLQSFHNLPENDDNIRALEILESNHAHAYLDHQAARVVKAFNEGDWDQAEKLDDLLRDYDRVEYPTGIMRLLVSLQEKAFELKDLKGLEDTQKALEQITSITGNKFLSMMLQTAALARDGLMTGMEDYIRQAAGTLYSDLTGTDLTSCRGQLAMVLCEIAIKFADFEAARRWSARCTTHWSECSIDSRAIATELDLRIQYLSPPQPASYETYPRYLAYFENAVVAYQCKLSDQAAFETRSLNCLLEAATRMPHPTLESKEEAVSDVLNRMSRLNESLGLAQTELRASFLENAAKQKQILGSRHGDWQLDLEALEMMREALKMYQQQAKGLLTFSLINAQQRIASIWYAMHQKKRRAGLGQLAFGDLAEALDGFEKCLIAWRAFRLIAQEIECQYWIARVYYNRFLYNIDSYSDLIGKLKDAEEGFDRRRLEISVQKGLTCLQDKQALSKDQRARDIYSFAVRAGVVRQDNDRIWDWVQKSKARSLSDLIGLGAIVPASLMISINGDADARALVMDEERLFEVAKAGTATTYVQAQRDLTTLRQKMKEHPLTCSLLDIRYGTATSLVEIERIANDPESGLHNRQFVAFDWFISGQDIYLLSMNSADRQIKHFQVNTTLNSVVTWIQQYLSSAEGRKASIERADSAGSPLRQLDVLIEHIPRIASAGQLLVLCPSGPLATVPLHALHLPSNTPGWQQARPTLIERNPVVYASSLTTFVQCCRGAQSRPESSRGCFYSVYEQRGEEQLDELERRNAYQYTNDLATQQKGNSATGSHVRADLLSSQWPECSVIYFHGHCERESPNIMDQGIVISKFSLAESGSPEGLFDEELFTVKSFFDVPLNRPLVLLMACGSVSQEIGAGDEPLGILTALLCAGAASVVGTIWPVASEVSRIFTKAFFEALEPDEDDDGNSCQSSTRVVNLAAAMQRAVKAVKGSHWRQPKHWAPFVLYGAPFQRIARHELKRDDTVSR